MSAHAEFTREFDAETGHLLRRRFVWLVVSIGVVYLMARLAAFAGFGAIMLASAARMVSDKSLQGEVDKVVFGRWGMWLVLLLTLADVGVLVWSGLYVQRGRLKLENLVRFTQNIFVYFGASQVAFEVILKSPGFPWQVCFYHVLACAFLPWTPRQAARAIVPVVILNLVADVGATTLAKDGWNIAKASGLLNILGLLMTPFAAAPGTLIAWIKHSRRLEAFRVRMLTTRYGQIRRELVDARRIHEALFPQPVTAGPLRFEYRYEPMLAIGGDYLYARFSPSVDGAPPAFNLLLMDVTGHGIAAALTVNRLYGEVERLFAEDPHAGPGDVLAALNRYVHLTLATHSVYVTALCIRVDQSRDLLEYASGGHPPAFLCAADGRIEQLDSTSFVLGAAAGADFNPAVEQRRFVPGDTLLAYTDGALECRNQQGRMLGVAGLKRVLTERHSPKPTTACELAAAVISAVEGHRAGPAEDDTLVVEVKRQLGTSAGPAENRVESRRIAQPLGA